MAAAAREGSRSVASEPTCGKITGQMKTLFLCLTALAAGQCADYQLKASPSTVVWGYYWSQAKPVLRIKSGDTVEIQTMTTGSPT